MPIGVAGCNQTIGLGADAVVIYAATDSDEPVNQAFDLCRQKGKVVGVGVFGMRFDREKMYRKELDFLISTILESDSGPGQNKSGRSWRRWVCRSGALA